jgi:hypothetical protein
MTDMSMAYWGSKEVRAKFEHSQAKVVTLGVSTERHSILSLEAQRLAGMLLTAIRLPHSLCFSTLCQLIQLKHKPEIFDVFHHQCSFRT